MYKGIKALLKEKDGQKNSLKNRLPLKESKKKYTKSELSRALDLIEEGYSHSEVSKDMQINKSILAREMRKRKNEKGGRHIEEYRKYLVEEDTRTFNEYVKSDV